MKTRYIFDLDGTLLTANYAESDKYFVDVYGEKATSLSNNIGNYLNRYERNHTKYEVDTLRDYLCDVSGIDISQKVIKEWIVFLKDGLDFKEEDVAEVLEALKKNNKSIAVLTNWFGTCQKQRLENAGLIDYIDEIYAGDQILKPNKEAYLIAARSYNPEEVLFIGDNLDFDYIGPRSCGYDSILYDKNEIHHKSIVKVKKLNEILRVE